MERIVSHTGENDSTPASKHRRYANEYSKFGFLWTDVGQQAFLFSFVT